jgi:DNA-binding transcriptional regulator YiaG
MSDVDATGATPQGMAAWVSQHLAAQDRLSLPPQAVWPEYLTPLQIRDGRQNVEISQRALALALDVSQGRTSRWETGTAIPTRREFVRLRELFNLPKEGCPHE